MSILAIWASPDTDGLTAEAKNNFCNGIRKAGTVVDEIHLNRKKIGNCQACGKFGYGLCSQKGQCVLPDDFADIYEKMVQADAIVFVTPVYWHDISENFKALLDRLRRCETSHNGYLQSKKYVAIACAGGYGLGVIEALCRLEETCRHMGMQALDRIPIVRYNRDYAIPMLEEAGKIFANTYAEFRFDDFDFNVK